MLFGGPIERRDSEALAEERFQHEQRNQHFLDAIFESEHEAWLLDVVIEHSRLRFGTDAIGELKFTCPDASCAKMADALEAMARAFRKAGGV